MEGKPASIPKTSTKKIGPGVEIDTEQTMRLIISEDTCFPPNSNFPFGLQAHNWFYLSNEIYSSFSLFTSAWTSRVKLTRRVFKRDHFLDQTKSNNIHDDQPFLHDS